MDSSTSISDNPHVVVGDETLQSPDADIRTNRRRAHAIELVLVALTPIVIFYAYRVQPMPSPLGTLDPTLYTAYINNGPEVLERFGAERYYWTRLGMVLPGRVFHLLFGAVPGFFVFRFLLAAIAVLPAYELFRRLRGRAAGAVAVVVILVNPVILRAWGTDYPSSAAIAYLLGGSACLLMPGASGRRRWAWLMAAAAFFTLAIHCNIIITGLVACTVFSYAAVFGARAPRRMLMQIAVMAATGVVVSFVLVVGAKLMFGVTDIIGPNRRAVEDVQETYQAFFHSTNWRWLLRDTHLVVIPVVLVAWVLLRGTLHRSSLGREETVAFLSLLLQAIAFTVWEFAFNGSTLEHYLYFSLLWAGVSFLAAFVLVMMWDPRGSDRRYLATAAVVLLTPWLFHLAGWRPAFTFWPWVPVLLAVFGVSAVAARGMRSRRATGSTAVMFVTAVALVAVCFVLTIGKRQNLPLLAGQVAQPDPVYGQVLFNGNDRYVDMYRVASQVPRGVPAADDEPGLLLKWWARGSSELVSMSAAMYLVTASDFVGLDFDRQRLIDDPPRFVMLLGDSTEGFAEMTEILQDTGFEVEQEFDRTLSEGDATLYQRLLRVTPPGTASTTAGPKPGVTTD